MRDMRRWRGSFASWFCGWCAACLALAGGPAQASPAVADIRVDVDIDAAAPARPFPHFWEEMFGSGRAALALRAGYREDLRAVRSVTGFSYVRFHGILHDELGVYREDTEGRAVYNFAYIDQIYDGLLENGVRPFVEIGFMPSRLALRRDVHAFWYRPIVSPPRDYGRWDDLIRALARHLIGRYGIEEVARWYFEVWNEPNIDFWTGEPKQATYFELYDHTARALKSVDPRLRVGGPATSSAHWIPEFLAHAAQAHSPVDFVSTHGYADDSEEDLFGSSQAVAWKDRVCLAVSRVHRQIRESALPHLPLMWTEWNVASADELHARDTAYVGAALARVIHQCDGQVDMMSFWTFSDVFEERGPGPEPFEGMFGLVALGGIRKPSFTAYALLHRLGNRRIPLAAPEALATLREDGSLAIALWHVVDPDERGGAVPVRLHLRNLPAGARLQMTRIDDRRGSSLAAYRAMGSPRYPSRAEVAELNRAATVPAPEPLRLDAHGELELTIEPNGLTLIEASAH